MQMLLNILKLARPQQWTKNAFVFVALIFSGRFFETAPLVNALIAFASFSMASSGVYFFNDYRDIDGDKQHPIKCRRPLASGALPSIVGPVGFISLLLGALMLSWSFLGPLATAILGAYVVMNIAYSMGLKHIVIIDVLIIAAGFVLRILAGAAAVNVMPSTWLILCTVTISLFLGFTKRRAEVVHLGESGASHRSVLSQYNTAFLDQMISIVTAASLVCYILYTVDEHTVEMVGSTLLLTTVPLVLYGIFRYLFLVYHAETGGDPTRTVFTDIPLLITGAIWTIMCGVIILHGKDLLIIISRIV